MSQQWLMTNDPRQSYVFSDGRATVTDEGGRFGRSMRKFFGVAAKGRTWSRVLFLLSGLVTGVAAFSILVTGIATGGGLAITLVGLPILVAMMYLWCVMADGLRAWTNLLLGTAIAPLRFAGERGALWSWTRIKARMSNSLTWRSLVYLFLDFPLGLATFIVAVVAISAPLGLMALPVTYWFEDPERWDGQTFAGIDPNNYGLVLAVAIAGFFAFFAALHGLNWLAVGRGRLAVLFFASQRAAPAVPSVSDRAKAAFQAWTDSDAVVVATTLTPPSSAPGANEPDRPSAEAATAPRISVDVVMRSVHVGAREVELTPKEFDLLALFAQNPGRPFSRDELLDRIWKNEYDVTDRTIDTHVQRLRKKLGEQAEAIQTVWGVGYKFQAKEPEERGTAPRTDG